MNVMKDMIVLRLVFSYTAESLMNVKRMNILQININAKNYPRTHIEMKVTVLHVMMAMLSTKVNVIPLRLNHIEQLSVFRVRDSGPQNIARPHIYVRERPQKK